MARTAAAHHLHCSTLWTDERLIPVVPKTDRSVLGSARHRSCARGTACIMTCRISFPVHRSCARGTAGSGGTHEPIRLVHDRLIATVV